MSITRILRHSLSWSKNGFHRCHKFQNSLRNFSLNAVKDEFPPGRCLHGFTVKKIQEVPELCLLAVSLVHNRTNAEYLHLARDDKNNVFSVAFRTTPMDSTGVPHILEHTTLCGSRKYPCRDPFFKMLNRSLSTFMNAFTASDNTLYPFSTQNPKDFQNLLSVYLDAAFHPNLTKSDFLQEGWRLEHEVVDDPSSPIVFKGVVFNEMKGAFADSDRIFVQQLMNKLLPGHTYSFISGGDPLAIPQLTWEQLKQFHADHYHPSNARFYTYGNFPLSDHLKVINEEALAGFENNSRNTSVPDEQRWKEPRRLQVTCPQDPLAASPDQQTTVAVSYLLGGITDNFESLTLQLLCSLLTDGPNSPFYQSLIKPNIGSGYAPATGYDGQTKEATFSIGLKGIRDSDVNMVLEKIEETIDNVINGTFPQERIDGLLHNIELGLKHQTSNFGLSFLLNLSSLWNHDGDTCDALAINKKIELFKEKLKENPRFLQEKVQQYLKNNPHKLVLTMQPENGYEDKLKEAEAQLLNEKVTRLTESQKSNIFEQGLELQKKQNEESDVSVLPSVTLSDIELHLEPTPLENISLGGVLCQICSQPTNGVTYFRAVLNTKDLSDEDKLFLPIFCNIVTRMGAEGMSYQQLAQQIELNTGGLNASVHLTEDAADVRSYEEGIRLYSHCLSEKTTDMMRLWNQIFNGANLTDVDRLKTLFAEEAMALASNVAGVGHSYAMTRAGSTLSSLGALKETFFGLNQVRYMKRLAELEDLGQISERMQKLANTLFTKNHLRIAINTLPDFVSKASAEVEAFVDSLPGSYVGGSRKTKDDLVKCEGRREHIVLPFPVNFVSRCVPGVGVTHEDFAKLEILTKLMTAKFLHREIREKGGAYGGGAATKSSGVVLFYSYRDPRNQATLEAFDAAVDWVLKGTFTDQDIVEAKLGLFSSVDQPIAPGDKGSANFLYGLSDGMKQKRREQLLAVSRSDIHDVATRYLKNAKHSGEVILGPETDLLKGKNWVVSSDHNI